MKPATEIEPTIVNVRRFNWRIQCVRFPKLNKNETITQYRQELLKDCDTQRVLVDEIMLFAAVDYHAFCNTIITEFDWMPGKGGFDSDYNPVDENGETLPQDKLFGGAYPKELEAWRNQSYTIGLLCINTANSEIMVVDPEGYNYARYVGFLS